MTETNVSTISDTTKIIKGFGRANVLLPRGIKLHIDTKLYSSKSHRKLINFKDIRLNEYLTETTNEGKITLEINCVLEKLPTLSSVLCYSYISTIEAHIVVNHKFTDYNKFVVWHDQLSHLGSIILWEK